MRCRASVRPHDSRVNDLEHPEGTANSFSICGRQLSLLHEPTSPNEHCSNKLFMQLGQVPNKGSIKAHLNPIQHAKCCRRDLMARSCREVLDGRKCVINRLTSGMRTEKRAQSRTVSKGVWTLSMMTTGMHPCRMASAARDDQPSPTPSQAC